MILMSDSLASSQEVLSSESSSLSRHFFNTNDACIPDGINGDVLQVARSCDWRLLSSGLRIAAKAYADQPYLVMADDGALVCVVTTGIEREGSAGQHVASMRSTDGGTTWSKPTSVESPENPESSYAVLLKVPSGRIYCFYNYNADNIRQIETVFPGNPVTYRVDTLGYYVFKFSDDHGKSWSDKYYEVPIRETEIDRKNVHHGRVRFFWNVGRPFIHETAAYLSIHKVGGFGDGFIDNSEGWLVRSDNLLTEHDPEKLRWETLPEGEVGLRTPEGGGKVAEEQSYVILGDGSIYAVYRSIDGYPVESYSRDGGRTWEPPRYKCYADGRRMKNPRAANFVWKCSNGNYLHWFHNHGGHFIENPSLDAPLVGGYMDRNPAWISAGQEKDGPNGKVIAWSQPEILLYEDDPYIKISYPDFIEFDDAAFISETQKDTACLHRIDSLFLERLWGQFVSAPVDEGTCLLSLDHGGSEVSMPGLPKFRQRDFRSGSVPGVNLRQGFTLCLSLHAAPASATEILLDNRTEGGLGWFLALSTSGHLRLVMSDGQTTSLHECETGFLQPGGRHAVAVVVDGGPCIVSFIIDGRFCDGGEERQFGWSRFSPNLRNVAGCSRLTVSSAVQSLKIFGRALMTCEVIALQKME